MGEGKGVRDVWIGNGLFVNFSCLTVGVSTCLCACLFVCESYVLYLLVCLCVSFVF